MGKRVSIVFEEGPAVADGIGFNVFLDGIDPHRMKTIDALSPEDQLKELSTSEFWALRCFQIVGGVLARSGAFRAVVKKV